MSVPVHRNEFTEIKGANVWTVRNLLSRLEEQGNDDPWRGMEHIDQQITTEMRETLGMK